MKNSDYWRNRMTDLAAAGFDESNAAYLKIADEYRKAISAIETDIAVWYQRIADNNEISLASARKLLKDNELEEFKWTVDEYIANGIINSIDQRFMKELENASAKVHINRLEALKLQLRNEIESLMAKMYSITSEHLEDTYTDQFYYSAYEIAKGTGVGQNLARLDKKKIAQVLMRPWTADGKNFSDRIWDNKDKLVNSLNKALTQHVIRGTAPQKIISEFTKKMGVSRNQAANIIQTETAAISSAAQMDCYKELDVEEYEIVETLDSRTCGVCADLDGKVFHLSEYEVGVTAPPFHPRCRGCTAPYFNDEFTMNERRAARGEDGKHQLVPSNMTYKEWKEAFTDICVNETKPIEKNENIGYTRSVGEFKIVADGVKNLITDYSIKSSKWSGKINMDNSLLDDNIAGVKEWNCDISLVDTADDGVVLHEMLHSCSVSYYSASVYIKNKYIEEASVEFLTQQICNKHGISHKASYTNLVRILELVNGSFKYGTDIEFAIELFNIPLPDRYEWFESKVVDRMKEKDASFEEFNEVLLFIRELQGGDKK